MDQGFTFLGCVFGHEWGLVKIKKKKCRASVFM